MSFNVVSLCFINHRMKAIVGLPLVAFVVHSRWPVRRTAPLQNPLKALSSIIPTRPPVPAITTHSISLWLPAIVNRTSRARGLPICICQFPVNDNWPNLCIGNNNPCITARISLALAVFYISSPALVHGAWALTAMPSFTMALPVGMRHDQWLNVRFGPIVGAPHE